VRIDCALLSLPRFEKQLFDSESAFFVPHIVSAAEVVYNDGSWITFLDHIPRPHAVINNVISDVIISDGPNQYLNFHFSTF